MAYVKYSPLTEIVQGKEVLRLMGNCPPEARYVLDTMVGAIEEEVRRRNKKAHLGTSGAAEIVGRLVMLGLIGEGPVDERFMERIARCRRVR